MPKVSALYRHPIKGCAGVAVSEMQLDALGPVGDRRMMVVDEDGAFLTQRNCAKLSLIRPTLTFAQLTVDAPGMQSLTLPLAPDDAARVQVQVWSSSVSAVTMGTLARQWFSDFLGTSAQLVRMDDHSQRIANPDYAPPNTPLSFADGYPILLLSDASLDQLNTKLTETLPMNRFRPNLVVRGTEPHAEDGWSTLRIGDVILDVVKPCDRCTVTTIDQATGISAKEPLTTLATYRRRGNKVYFGQNVVHQGIGTLRVGDDVEIVATCQPTV